MWNWLKIRLTYANVMATVATFIALGGTSYGLATGAIDSREIKNSTLRSTDVKDNQLRSSDVRNGALLRKDFKAGEIPTGAQGPRGPSGATGAPGLGARAYAKITAEGDVVEAQSSGITDADVTHGAGSGVYCIDNLSFTPRVAVASITGDAALASVAQVDIPTTGQCVASQQITVYTFSGDETAADWTFYIAVL